MSAIVDESDGIAAHNDAFRKGPSPVEIVVPAGLDELSPMMRLVVGAVFTVRRYEFPESDDGRHDTGTVDVLGKPFRWAITHCGDSYRRVLAVYVPSEGDGS